jgi:hypothetical protein
MRCCFRDKDEAIQHLFIGCPLIQIVWRIVHMIFNIDYTKFVGALVAWGE